MRTSKGNAVSEHVSVFVGSTFLKAATMEKIVNGFRKSGVLPLNHHVFDNDFNRMGAVVDKQCESRDNNTKNSAVNQVDLMVPSAAPAATPPRTGTSGAHQSQPEITLPEDVPQSVTSPAPDGRNPSKTASRNMQSDGMQAPFRRATHRYQAHQETKCMCVKVLEILARLLARRCQRQRASLPDVQKVCV